MSSFGQAWNDPPISWFDVQSLEQVSLGVIETASGDNARAERQNRSNSSKKSVEAKSVSISACSRFKKYKACQNCVGKGEWAESKLPHYICKQM